MTLATLDKSDTIMKLLLETDRIDSESKGAWGSTPMSWSAGYGRKAVVRLLLETGQIGVDPENPTRYTPLSLAAKYGYLAVMNILLGTWLRIIHTKHKAVT